LVLSYTQFYLYYILIVPNYTQVNHSMQLVKPKLTYYNVIHNTTDNIRDQQKLQHWQPRVYFGHPNTHRPITEDTKNQRSLRNTFESLETWCSVCALQQPSLFAEAIAAT